MGDQGTEPAIENVLSVVLDEGAIDRKSVVRGEHALAGLTARSMITLDEPATER